MKPVKTRVILIAVFIFISFFSIIPSIYPNTPGWWKAVIGNAEMHLGLDLQGGVYLVEKVEVDKAVKEKLYKDYSDIKSFIKTKNIGKGKDLTFKDEYIALSGNLLKNKPAVSRLKNYLKNHHISLQLSGDIINFKPSALALYKKEAVGGGGRGNEEQDRPVRARSSKNRPTGKRFNSGRNAGGKKRQTGDQTHRENRKAYF